MLQLVSHPLHVLLLCIFLALFPCILEWIEVFFVSVSDSSPLTDMPAIESVLVSKSKGISVCTYDRSTFDYVCLCNRSFR